MASTFGIQHKRDGRWYVGFTADRQQRLIWSHNEREAWRGAREEAEATAALLVKYRKPALPEPQPIDA